MSNPDNQTTDRNIHSFFVMKWSIFLRGDGAFRQIEMPNLSSIEPTYILTHAPGLYHETMPVEVALLLPSNAGASAFIDGLIQVQNRQSFSAIGLFLADPFLSVEREAKRLRALGVSWVANIPAVDQYGADFTHDLSDVGLDQSLELENLRRFKEEGFSIMAASCGTRGGEACAAINPDIAFSLPNIGEFAAGFPSPRQRRTSAEAVRAGLIESRWEGPILAFGERGEGQHESQWPSFIDGLIASPELCYIDAVDR